MCELGTEGGNVGLFFVRLIFLEQHAKQPVSCDRNDQKAARQADCKKPPEEMRQHLKREIDHMHAPAAARLYVNLPLSFGKMGLHRVMDTRFKSLRKRRTAEAHPKSAILEAVIPAKSVFTR